MNPPSPSDPTNDVLFTPSGRVGQVEESLAPFSASSLRDDAGAAAAALQAEVEALRSEQSALITALAASQAEVRALSSSKQQHRRPQEPREGAATPPPLPLPLPSSLSPYHTAAFVSFVLCVILYSVWVSRSDIHLRSVTSAYTADLSYPTAGTCAPHCHVWESYGLHDPRLCSAVQYWPTLQAQFGHCLAPEWENMDSREWGGLLRDSLAVNCLYHPTFHTRYTYQRLPSPTARHYVVFVQAHLPAEPPADHRRRLLLNNFTLNRLRSQLGERCEITVVELFDARIEPGTYPAADTLISHTRKEGQDWGMYQDGIMHVYHRLEQFDSVTVLNDQMVGPFTSYEWLLSAAHNMSDYFVTSFWPGCCIRGFYIAFARSIVRTERWRRYWRQAQFPCAKLGPMITGEGAFGKGDLDWRSCSTATQNPFGKNSPLQQITDTHSPFIYRWALEQQFGHNLDALQGWLKQYDVTTTLHVDRCAW